MGSIQQISINLPTEVAEIIERKVQSGDYASASDVVLDGMQALIERDGALERWLREDVLAGHAEYLADPSKGVAADEILSRIKKRRASK